MQIYVQCLYLQYFLTIIFHLFLRCQCLQGFQDVKKYLISAYKLKNFTKYQALTLQNVIYNVYLR